MRNNTTLVALVAAGLGLTAPAVASAYELSRTETGRPVHWEADLVQVVVDPSLEDITAETVGLSKRSFQAWANVDGAKAPTVSLSAGAGDEVGYRLGQANMSTIRFARKGFEAAGTALAITVVSFDDAGKILDADIVINGLPGRHFDVLEADGSDKKSHEHDDEHDDEEEKVVFDLEDVLTHEVGHFLGMAHNTVDASVTMYPDIGPRETCKRAIELDDASGLRELYDMAEPQAVASCGVRHAPAAPVRWVPLAVLVLGGAAALRARSRRRRVLSALVSCALLVPWLGTETAVAGDARETAHVTEAASRWVGGLLVTRLTLDAGGSKATVDVLGGHLDGVHQVVAGRVVPVRGTSTRVRRGSDGALVPHDLVLLGGRSAGASGP